MGILRKNNILAGWTGSRLFQAVRVSVFSFFSFFACSAWPQFIGAAGFCYLTNYTDSSNVGSVYNTTFTVSVENEKVSIRVSVASDHYCSWNFDGTNSFYLVDSPDRVNSDPGMNAAVTLHQREFPYDANPIVRLLWLGLASTHYFASTTNELLLVPWLGLTFDGTFSYDWETQKSDQPPYFPAKITFVASPLLWEKEQTRRISKTGKFPFQLGYVGGVFEVKESGRAEDMTIPTYFILDRYRNGGEPGQVLEHSEVRVTNLFRLQPSGLSYRPKITRPTDVCDMREETPEMLRFGITYTLTNDAWLEKGDPRRTALIEQHKPEYAQWRSAVVVKEAGARAKPEIQARNRQIVRVVLVGSLIGMPLIYLTVRKTSKQ
jgi:hypothetical protein